MKSKLLFVEDEIDLGHVIKQYLELNGFDVMWVKTGSEAIKQMKGSQKFDLVILDVQLPDIDGFSLAQEVKKIQSNIFFLFLTARTEKKDKILGLGLGAEDYISKPFDIDELILRIKVILRRSNLVKDQVSLQKIGLQSFQTVDVVFDENLMQLCVENQKPVVLTQKEVNLLKFLYTNRNKVVKREQILTELWGENDYFMGRSLDVFISRFRKIFSLSRSVKIENIYGVGFIFKLEEFM